ncbi:MAG TPA: putative nucleotidyltransferase substrate binding domain-containing protein [Thermoleophilaceae bacterium]|nr:putative nucleotidyltransferase substrate binding domain-containing protein [Thermoleophilaceae bacterium]
MHDIAEFLRGHPPFDTLDEETLERVAASAEIEFHAASTAILESAEETSRFAYVVRRGSVELLIGGRLLDLLHEGEMFGFASLLEEAPLGFVARAAEDTLVYRIPAGSIRPVLERPDAVRFVARSMNKGVRLLAGHEQEPVPTPAGRRVRELIRAAPLVCPPEITVQDAARRMIDAGVTCTVVDLGDRLGIVTDRDIRTRVVAAGAGPDTPISEVMSAPAWTVAGDRTGTEALLEMLDHGVRHLPVLDAGRRLIGVLDDVDLMASERRAPFRVRAQIARSPDAEAVARAASEMHDTVIALHDAELPAAAISRAIGSIHDSATRRLIDLAHAELGPAPVPYTWLATGSYGRFEPFPSSDVDTALAWDGPDEDEELRGWMRTFAERILEGLAAAGFPSDDKGAVASSPLFARSIEAWEAAARSWVEHPDRDRGLMLLCVAVESAPVWGTTAAAERLAKAFARSPNREVLLRRLAAAALAERPPTGFRRHRVLLWSGERKVLDIKKAGLLPIEALARWSGLAAGVSAASTRARLEASEKAGTLQSEDAAILRDAFELVCELRMEHQVAQLRAGRPPDDLIEPASIAPITRTALKEAFRSVARVQRGIGLELGFAAR